MILLLLEFFVYLNSIIRMIYPSSYVPFTASTHKLIGHPITARILATCGELSFYYQESSWLDNGNLTLFYISIIGEIFCWTYVVGQSELFGFIEDCTWFTAQLFACYILFIQSRYIDLFGIMIFEIYMLFIHLPNTFKRIPKNIKCDKIINELPNKPRIMEQDSHTQQWMTLMLITLPICYIYFKYYQIMMYYY